MEIKKIFWLVLLLIVLVWLSTGIYFLRTGRTPKPFSLPSKTTPQPTKATLSENLDAADFIIGHFQSWEEIPDSEDRYILLINPKTNNAFPKIRVGFEFSSLFSAGPGKENTTVFAVEKNEGEYDVLGSIKDFTVKEIDKLIQPGEIIKVLPEKKAGTMESFNLKDEDGSFLASWLCLRRKGGKAEVEKELKRKSSL